jgi:hypothetical protein
MDMNERLRRAKRQYDAVREFLLREWDPIGVSDVPEAQDEYDSYVWPVCGMLARHEPMDRLTDHLWRVETTHMGLRADRQHAELIADRLIKLWERIEAGA